MDNKKTVDVGAVIDSAKYFWVPFGITIMMIIIMATDGYDLFLMGQAGPRMVAAWNIGGAVLQDINLAGLAGMAVGSVGMGWLGDRIGRKKSYFTCLLFLFAGSLLCYLAAKSGTPETATETIKQMTLWRFVTGLGMGGVTPLATALISEWTSKNVRAVVVALVISSVPVGGYLARFAIKHVDWPTMFLLGGVVPLALFILFGFLLPESPKYMAQNPPLHAKLARALNRLVGEKRYDGTENFVVQEAGKRSANWLSTIWNSHYAMATLFIWIAFSVNSYVLYMYTNNLALLLPKDQVAADVASAALGQFSIGAFFGSIGGAFLIRWFGSRWVGSRLALLGVAATALIGLHLSGSPQLDQILQGPITWLVHLFSSDTAPVPAVVVLGFLAGVSFNGMQAFMYAVSAHSYPTEIRGSAIGLAQTVSRAGALLSPWVAQKYLGMKPLPGAEVFFYILAATAFITVVSFFLIPSHIPKHTKG